MGIQNVPLAARRPPGGDDNVGYYIVFAYFDKCSLPLSG